MKNQKINDVEAIKTDKVMDISLRTTTNNDNPALELRKILTDPDLIKMTIASAFLERPLIIYPKFRNKIIALNILIEKGIIFRENDNYFFVL